MRLGFMNAPTKQHINQLRARWKTSDGSRLLAAVTELLTTRGARQALIDLVSGLPEAAEIPGYVDLRGIEFNGEIYELELNQVDLSFAHSQQGRSVADPFILLKRCHLRSSRFNQISTPLIVNVCRISQSELIGANLQKNMFHASEVAGCRFDNARLMRSDFVGCDLTDCRFNGADLTGANLMLTKCVNTDFREATLRGARFDDAFIATSTTFDKDGPFANPLTEEVMLLEVVTAALRLVNTQHPEYRHLKPILVRLREDLQGGKSEGGLEHLSDSLDELQREELAYLLGRAGRET